MKLTICRRCNGRKSHPDDNGKPCFLCLGKGQMGLSEDELTKYFDKFRRKFAQTEESVL